MSELLDKMAKNPMKLISNTGTGLRAVFSRGTLGMKFVKGTLDNAAWSGTHMKFDVTRIWQNENLAIGVLVHEYHHFLIKADQKRKYADEFVAHWKQYLAMNDKRTAEQKVTHINHWLLDDPNGYKLRGNGPLRISDENATDESGKFNGTEFTGPADAGVIWTRYEHNV